MSLSGVLFKLTEDVVHRVMDSSIFISNILWLDIHAQNGTGFSRFRFLVVIAIKVPEHVFYAGDASVSSSICNLQQRFAKTRESNKVEKKDYLASSCERLLAVTG